MSVWDLTYKAHKECDEIKVLFVQLNAMYLRLDTENRKLKEALTKTHLDLGVLLNRWDSEASNPMSSELVSKMRAHLGMILNEL